MKIILFVCLTFAVDHYAGQIIDIGGVWEITCPQGCSCQILKFSDLPLHQWFETNFALQQSPMTIQEQDEDVEGQDHHHHHQYSSFDNELLKVATCVVSDDTEQLLSDLPSDLQVLTILESVNNDTEVILRSEQLQRFPELLSLDIQGAEYEASKKRGGIVLTADAFLPLGTTLLYLNLERVTLTSLTLQANSGKANLVVKPANSSNEETPEVGFAASSSQSKGHRLIFLSQQNNDDDYEKTEILPYDIYKQELEGYRDNGGLFTGLSALTHLRVYDCALTDVTWHMFDGLDSLVYLSLERNNLKFIPEFCFYGTPNLQSLSLASNQLLTLKSVDLAGLLTLKWLDLRGNNLTFLSELSFPPFPALTSADFRENPLDSVFPSTFEIMNTTTKLYLGGNGSRLKLQKNSFLGLRNLETLYLYNLEVPVLERFILQGMPELIALKMRGNISSIDFDAFLDLSKLIDLDLSHCHIQRVSMDAFYGLEHVERIDLSYNDLELIPPGLFTLQQQKGLKEIYLSNNKLTILPWDFFKNLRRSIKQPIQIQNLRLDGNPWDCSCSMINWNPHVVSKTKETAPRCLTPKRLQNWGVFQALRKGNLGCKRQRRRNSRRKSLKPADLENDIAF